MANRQRYKPLIVLITFLLLVYLIYHFLPPSGMKGDTPCHSEIIKAAEEKGYTPTECFCCSVPQGILLACGGEFATCAEAVEKYKKEGK